MNSRAVSCTRCQATLNSPVFFNIQSLVPCPSGGALLRVELFPAAFREQSPGAWPESILVEGESSCFYHPQKKAVVPCDSCGRFLCALCDVELTGQHLCPVCLERGQQKRTLEHLENQRVRYDGLALLIALVPLLAWPLTLITAPSALWFAVRHWRSPSSLVRPSKTRLVIAVILAVLQIVGWAVGLTYAFSR